eukprot:1792155-Rhodomonas_salina.1
MKQDDLPCQAGMRSRMRLLLNFSATTAQMPSVASFEDFVLEGLPEPNLGLSPSVTAPNESCDWYSPGSWQAESESKPSSRFFTTRVPGVRHPHESVTNSTSSSTIAISVPSWHVTFALVEEQYSGTVVAIRRNPTRLPLRLLRVQEMVPMRPGTVGPLTGKVSQIILFPMCQRPPLPRAALPPCSIGHAPSTSSCGRTPPQS